MQTRKQQMSSGGFDSYANFIGDDSGYQDWFGVIGRSRDSKVLEESNFECILKELGGESDNVRVERYNHWAVGWIEEVYVRPDSKEYTTALKIEQKLSDYPVFDEEHFSTAEQEAADNIWEQYYDHKERITYIREHRTQFEFHDFEDLIGCIRGHYFSGDACELIGA